MNQITIPSESNPGEAPILSPGRSKLYRKNILIKWRMWQKSYASFLFGNRIALIKPIFGPTGENIISSPSSAISFWAMASQWDRNLPADGQRYFKADWMKSHILDSHGPLCSLYQAYKGDKDNEDLRQVMKKLQVILDQKAIPPHFFMPLLTG